MSTEISWTDETWNPTVGCSRVSPGCDNCYAIGVAHRAMQPAHVGLTKRVGYQFGDRTEHHLEWTGEVRMLPDRLDTPLHWRKPRRVFVDSMSDLFHLAVPKAFVREVFGVMAFAEQHTFQVLTKRPQRMSAFMAGEALAAEIAGIDTWRPAPNVWLGTSVENQRYADLRIPHLLATPAAVRFLSIEPLLGPIEMRKFLRRINDEARAKSEYEWTRDRIDWVIIGGESGPGARPMELEWAERIVDECRHWGVPVFMKQLGTVAGGKQHHDIDRFPASLQVREYPA